MRRVVVKVGGAALDDPVVGEGLWRALAELHRRLVAEGGALALVHGGGASVDRHLARLGIVSHRRDGLRITTDEEIGEVVAVLAGRVNSAIVGRLRALGVDAAGVCVGACARCERIDGAVDLGRVGRVVGARGSACDALLAAGVLAVVSSIGFDDEGGWLNVNADDAAAGLAAAVGAHSLVLLTDVPGVRGEDGRVVDALGPAEIERLVSGGVIAGGMIPKVRAALEASRSSGVPATIASWREPGALVGLAGGAHVGTRVSAQ